MTLFFCKPESVLALAISACVALTPLISGAFQEGNPPPPEIVAPVEGEEADFQDRDVQEIEAEQMLFQGGGDQSEMYVQLVEQQLTAYCEQYKIDEKLLAEAGEKLAEEFAATTLKESTMLFSDELDSEKKLQLARLLEPHIDASEYESLISEREFFKETGDKSGQDSILIFMDSETVMTLEQTQAVRECLKENWQSSWNLMALQMMISGRDDFSASLFGDSFEKAVEQLDEDQQAALNTKRISAIQLAFGGLDGDMDDVREQLQDETGCFVELKINEINRICALTEEQTKRILIAARGAAERSVDSRIEALEMFHEDQAMMQNMSAMESLMCPLSTLVLNQKIWTKTLEKTLSPKQFEALVAREDERLRFQKETYSQGMVLMIITEHEISRADFKGLHGLFATAFEKGSSGNIYHLMRMLSTITDEELAAAVSPAIYDALQPDFESMRAEMGVTDSGDDAMDRDRGEAPDEGGKIEAPDDDGG